MRRFDYDSNDEYRDDVDSFFDDEEYDEDEYEDEEEYRHLSIIEMVHADLASMDLDQRLLAMAIKVAEGTWFWKFLPVATKLKRIVEAYATLNMLMQKDEPEESE